MSTEEHSVSSGKGPCQLWRWVGDHTIAPFKIHPDRQRVQRIADKEMRIKIEQHIIAAIEATKAINRMMERPEMYGLNAEED